MDQYMIKENFTFRKPLDQRFYRDNYQKHQNWCLGEHIQSNETTFRSDLCQFKEEQNQQIVPTGLELQIYGISTGGIRIRVEPKESEKFKRYDVSKEDLMIYQSKLESRVNINCDNQNDSKEIVLTFPQNVILIVQKNPFKITLKEGEKETVIVNSFGQLVFEHGNLPVPNERHHLVHNDPIPHGACAVGIDFLFPSKDARLSGLAERASPHSLRDTKPDEPLRLFNSDSNKYEADNPVHLYGSIPFIICHSPSISCGLFWINSSDTYSSISTIRRDAVNSHDGRKISFLSETGFVDFVLFTGSFSSILDSYTSLTGRPFMPPLFSFGYHQCKWGYLTQGEVESVMKGLDDYSIPYDSVWLDVDHLKKFSPFEVDEKNFPHLDQLSVELDKNKRHLVRLSDPHFPTRKAHKQYCECISNPDFHVKEPNGKPYKGFCWPGRCIWPDFLNPECRRWYSSQFSNVGKEQSEMTPLNVHIWNDMNEPTIFMSDQFTFPKNVVHFDGTETRSTHNIYGVLNTSATYSGCVENGRRSFILTRSFWAGSQLYAFVWTGDNTASEDHMNVSIDMVLSLGLCGIPYTGADVGGFFRSPEHIFIAHWMRLASYVYPFFREHCIRTSARREPFLFQGKALMIAKQSICDRYKLISFWYTQGYRAHLTGIPIIKPLWAVFPNIDSYHGQINGPLDKGPPVIVGDTLLVNFKELNLPPGRWFYLWSGIEKKQLSTESAENYFNDADESGDVDIQKMPFIESGDFVLLRGGKIIPVHDEIEKSAELTVRKRLTVVVALDENDSADGELFMDDGVSFDYRDNQKRCLHRLFKYENGVFTSKSLNESDENLIPDEIKNVVIKTIKIYGVNEPSSIDNGLDYSYGDRIITIDNINNQVCNDFEIRINF